MGGRVSLIRCSPIPRPSNVSLCSAGLWARACRECGPPRSTPGPTPRSRYAHDFVRDSHVAHSHFTTFVCVMCAARVCHAQSMTTRGNAVVNGILEKEVPTHMHKPTPQSSFEYAPWHDQLRHSSSDHSRIRDL
jgi:hypothetical protein